MIKFLQDQYCYLFYIFKKKNYKFKLQWRPSCVIEVFIFKDSDNINIPSDPILLTENYFYYNMKKYKPPKFNFIRELFSFNILEISYIPLIPILLSYKYIYNIYFF